jgi:hypothetical protein
LRASAEDHYSHVLRLFDDGIAALEQAEAADTPLAPTVPSSPSTRNPLKRASEDDLDDRPAAKRPNSPRVFRNPRSPGSTTRSNIRSA